MPVTRSEIEKLIQRPVQPDTRVLSVYVEVDQSRASNLHREYVAGLKSRLRLLERQIPQADRERFRENAAKAIAFVEGYTPTRRGLALFSDTRAGFFHHRTLRVRVEDDAHWEQRPWVRPLIEALDEFERAAVVLVNKERARLFVVSLGEIEERVDLASEEKRSDRAASQLTLQRRDGERAHAHSKQVAEELERLAARKPFGRLILAGALEAACDLEKLLGKRLQSRLVGSVRLPIEAGDAEVLAAVERVGCQAERAAELAAVEDLLTAAAKNSHAALGWDAVIEALRQGRIRKLIYAGGVAPAASQCAKCESLLAGVATECPFCGSEARPVSDAVARVAELVVNSGAEAENVRGGAAERLRAAGGVGATLRF